ncbi:arachidonate 5-lipoxygenase-activating protein [Ambystoma mexicanum]|uniref:arachidonate 5-lipoxygenase-activating protein n=1 Tax=Ambystoma mexicanum TaxID=8296 RepID=UPI0037E817EF
MGVSSFTEYNSLSLFHHQPVGNASDERLHRPPTSSSDAELRIPAWWKVLDLSAHGSIGEHTTVKMEHDILEGTVLLAIVTLISAIQNAFFAHKVEHENTKQNTRGFQRTGSPAFERVYMANQNCVDAYPTFLAVLWCAGIFCSQAPAAFGGLMYLFVRQKYFVGYLGEKTQSTPGYIFGKRIMLFLFLMSLAGIINFFLVQWFGSNFEVYLKMISSTISPLLIIA